MDVKTRTEELQDEIRAEAELIATVALDEHGVSLDEDDRDAFDLGVNAGYTAAIRVFQRRGYL